MSGDNEDDRPEELAAAIGSMWLCTVPSLIMLFCSFIALHVRVPNVVVAALQHLAAGIVLSAVAVELVPRILTAPDDVPTLLAMTAGFASGIGMFLLLGKFCGHDDHDDDDDDDEHENSHNGRDAEGSHSDYVGWQGTRGRSTSEPGPAINASTRALIGKSPASKVKLVKEASFDGFHPQGAVPFPVVMVVAVATDAMVDGLLIGISAASGTRAGVVITAALSIEMGFLGLTFAATLRTQPPLRRVFTILLPPLVLILGGAFGGALSSLLALFPVYHTALVSFGIAALLYLVTEELLLEAHASQGPEEHIWYVDAMFFLGFFMSFVIEKFTRSLGR